MNLNDYAPTITTTPLPWHCYIPETQSRMGFYQSNLGWVELTKIPGLVHSREYVLASRLGKYVDSARWSQCVNDKEIFDWGNKKNKIDLQNLLINMANAMGGIDVDKTANAIYLKDSTNLVCQRFLRTRFEYAYIQGLRARTEDGKMYLAMGLRRFERLLGAAVRSSHVHHILPQATFKESRAEIRNLILLPAAIHDELHKIVYYLIEDEKNNISPDDAVREWYAVSTADDKEQWVNNVLYCAHTYSEALQNRAPKWEFIK